MQTFLPYASFEKSARCLDNKRLGKQRVEVYQILRALMGKTHGWRNHPAVRMWEDCEATLTLYGMFCCDEWVRREFRDTTKEKILALIPEHGKTFLETPWWWGVPAFHRSHRRALLAKNQVWYRKWFPNEEPVIDYWWPTKHESQKGVYVRVST